MGLQANIHVYMAEPRKHYYRIGSRTGEGGGGVANSNNTAKCQYTAASLQYNNTHRQPWNSAVKKHF